MADLPIEEVIHELEEKTCDKCGAEMVEIGEEERDELVYTPARFHIRRHIIKVYKCTKCGSDPDKDAELDDIEPCHIVKAYCQKPMIPGSYCSPELLAHIIFEKYGKAVPLHRQEKDFASKKIPLLKATMSNWVLTAAEQWCLPIVQKMTGQLLLSEVIHADETVIQVLHEDGRKATSESRMWIYCNGKINDRSIVIFDYKPTRKGANAEEFLKGWSGYRVRDQFSGYHVLKNVKHCGCWAHARRKFTDCLPKGIKDEDTRAEKALALIGKIFTADEGLNELSEDQRSEKRPEILKPLLDEYWKYIENIYAAGGSNLAKAVTYSLHQKTQLNNVLLDEKLELTNNRAERAVKPFVIGRKNWLFSDTDKGADASARCYSIIESANLNGLNVFGYMSYLLTELPKLGTEPSDEQLDSLLPWSDTLPDYCK